MSPLRANSACHRLHVAIEPCWKINLKAPERSIARQMAWDLQAIARSEFSDPVRKIFENTLSADRNCRNKQGIITSGRLRPETKRVTDLTEGRLHVSASLPQVRSLSLFVFCRSAVAKVQYVQRYGLPDTECEWRHLRIVRCGVAARFRGVNPLPQLF